MASTETIHTSTQSPDATESEGTLSSGTPQKKGWGRYRVIAIAALLFLFIDVGVLAVNWYTSFRIAEGALGVNLSGRQRMLSQRTAKSLFAYNSSVEAGHPESGDLEELRGASTLFDVTLHAFQHGETVPGGDGQPVFLPAVRTAPAIQSVDDAQGLWQPYKRLLAPVLDGTATDAQLRELVSYARTNNVKLLGLMNDLTTELERVSNRLAATVRAVQTIGLVLVLLNFFFLLFKFLRSLRDADVVIEAVNRENGEILSSVREGLFLLTPDLRLGTQISDATHRMFSRPVNPGENFLELLESIVSEKDLADTREYVELIFSPHVKEALVRSLNPLNEVRTTTTNRLGTSISRFLSFGFSRVYRDGGKIQHILVTVQEVTDRVELQHRLAAERGRSEKELNMLLKAIVADPRTMSDFIDRSEAQLLEVNERLRNFPNTRNSQEIEAALGEIARRVHSIKGEASMMELESLAAHAHAFESELGSIRQAAEAGGNVGEALLGLPVPLEEMLDKVSSLRTVIHGRLQQLEGADTPPPPAAQTAAAATDPSAPADVTAPPDTPAATPARTTAPPAPAMPPAGDNINANFAQLVSQVASQTGKQAETHLQMGSLADLPRAAADMVREITVQLLRNAVVHGIEKPEDRLRDGKSAFGRVDASLTFDGQYWHLNVRDDGRGLSAQRIRDGLAREGKLTPQEISAMGERELLMQIFKPGFSTAEETGMHAGRGVGMEIVGNDLQKLKANLSLFTREGSGTEFRIRFARPELH